MLRKVVSGITLTLLLITMLTLAFNIQPVKASGTIYIRADGSVDPLTAPIQRDVDVYTFTDNIYDEIVVERSNIIIDGDGHTLQGSGSGYGFYLYGMNNVTIEKTNIKNFHDGIWLCSSSSNSISGNNVTANNWYGIWLFSSSSNSISGNNIANNGDGIFFYYSSSSNSISGNNIANNWYGTHLYSSSNNKFSHNNFIDNNFQQAAVSVYSTSVWDDGYPSGGNYWSDHVTVDDFCGIYQDELGSDGIVDEPYVIDYNNRDNYPLLKPWSPVIFATTDVNPDALNLKSKGKWITAYVQLPEEYNPEDIDASTILLNETIQPVLDPKYDFVTNSSEYIVDHNGDGILERMVKFNRTEVASWICNILGIQYGNVTLAITGEADGTSFEGTDTVKVLLPGDADDDGDVDSNDFYIFSGCYGISIENSSYNPSADFNQDGYINSEDFYILSGNYGKTAV